MSIESHPRGFGGEVFRGVRDQQNALSYITCSATVHEVVVLGEFRPVARLRYEMVDVERTGGPAPLLAKEAVDASEGKLIAEPRAVRLVVGVSKGPVASLSDSGVAEWKKATISHGVGGARGVALVPPALAVERLSRSALQLAVATRQALGVRLERCCQRFACQ